jgi:hypothetical protein
MPKFLFTYRVLNVPLEQRLAELAPSAGAGGDGPVELLDRKPRQPPAHCAARARAAQATRNTVQISHRE